MLDLDNSVVRGLTDELVNLRTSIGHLTEEIIRSVYLQEVMTVHLKLLNEREMTKSDSHYFIDGLKYCEATEEQLLTGLWTSNVIAPTCGKCNEKLAARSRYAKGDVYEED